MQVMNYSEFRQNLASALDYVEDAHAPVIVKRGKTSAVLISLDEYNTLKETDYLLSNPANAEHLMRGIQAVKDRKLIQRDLIDD
ncbi:type II toxin-antitoxin system Phd/YefM family antitoxin [Moraxella oblonga]|uniref:type II toxin-antitoxin system Phd/YefM family antitoxin n=1 Tax=Moraxella oblonga TaxID=200413 RepID=UPI00082BD915|nr:type II toxin-antitoxin system prevent-host-death family antitoxin [Moraxella oblonga]